MSHLLTRLTLIDGPVELTDDQIADLLRRSPALNAAPAGASETVAELAERARAGLNGPDNASPTVDLQLIRLAEADPTARRAVLRFWAASLKRCSIVLGAGSASSLASILASELDLVAQDDDGDALWNLDLTFDHYASADVPEALRLPVEDQCVLVSFRHWERPSRAFELLDRAYAEATRAAFEVVAALSRVERAKILIELTRA